MHQKKKVWRALKERGVLDSKDPHLQKFVQFLRDHPTQCWEDVAPAFRERFYDCYEEVVSALAEIDDPLIRMALIRYADPEQPKERKVLRKLAEETDPERDPVTIKQLAQLDVSDVNKSLRRRTLPDDLSDYVKKE